VSQLSGLVAEAGLPSVKKESDKAGDSNNWSRVETARMTSSDTAKITIALFRKDSPDDASGVLMLYMKYYRGVWTVTGHEANGIFKSTGRIGEIGILDSHLELIRAIDRIGSGVPKRQH
jgi:hypothetical protein